MDTKLKYIFTLLLLVALKCTGQEYNWKSSVFANPNDGNSLFSTCSVNEIGEKFLLYQFNGCLLHENDTLLKSNKPRAIALLVLDENNTIQYYRKVAEGELYNTLGVDVLSSGSILFGEDIVKITINYTDSIHVFKDNLTDTLLENNTNFSKICKLSFTKEGFFLDLETLVSNCNSYSSNNNIKFLDDNWYYNFGVGNSIYNIGDTCNYIIGNNTLNITDFNYYILRDSLLYLTIQNSYIYNFDLKNRDMYVIGQSKYNSSINGELLNINSSLDHIYFISKIDSNGAVKWTRYFGINGWDSHLHLYDMHISSPNDIIIAGKSFAQSVPNTVRFQNAPTLFGGSSTDDYFVVCYDSLGNVKWQNKSKGFSRERLTSLTSDKDKNVYGLVTFLSSVEFASDTFYSKGSEDILLVCFDSLGNEKWAKQAGGTGLDQGFKIGIDSNENLYVLGGTKSSPVHFGTISYQLNGSNAQFFLAKLDTSSIPNIGIVPQEEPGFFTLYPNPNYGEFLVETKEGLISHIEISNLKGQVIYKDQPQSNKTEISLNYLPKGLFFVKITQSNGKVIVNKFVKK